MNVTNLATWPALCNMMTNTFIKFFLLKSFRFALNLSYFCLTFNVGKFGLDIFLTQLLFGLTEMPAHLLCFWLLELAGRKLSLMATLLVGGLLCLCILAVPTGNTRYGRDSVGVLVTHTQHSVGCNLQLHHCMALNRSHSTFNSMHLYSPQGAADKSIFFSSKADVSLKVSLK